MDTSKKNLSRLKDELNSSDLVRKCAQRHHTVGDPSAMKVCYLLRHYPDLSVSEIAQLVGLSVSAASRCLKKLKRAEVVSATRQAQTVRYRLRKNTFTRQLITSLGG